MMNNHLVKSDQHFDACEIKGETIALWIPISFALIGIMNSIVFSHFILNSNYKTDSIYIGSSSRNIENTKKTANLTVVEVNKSTVDMVAQVKQESTPYEINIKSRVGQSSQDIKNATKMQQPSTNNVHSAIENIDNLIVLVDSNNNTTKADNFAPTLNNITTVTKLIESKPKPIDDEVVENTKHVPLNHKSALLKDCPSIVSFNFSNASVVPDKQENLEQIQELILWAKQYSDSKLFIEGHSDSIGPEEYNLLLSHRRAIVIKKLLIEKGISKNQLIIRALGEEEPLQNQPSQSRKNRRVLVRIKDTENCINRLINGDLN